jgi:hypothetical protein
MMLCIPASASQTLDMQQKSGLLDNDCLVSFLQGKNVPFLNKMTNCATNEKEAGELCRLIASLPGKRYKV